MPTRWGAVVGVHCEAHEQAQSSHVWEPVLRDSFVVPKSKHRGILQAEPCPTESRVVEMPPWSSASLVIHMRGSDGAPAGGQHPGPGSLEAPGATALGNKNQACTPECRTFIQCGHSASLWPCLLGSSPSGSRDFGDQDTIELKI